MFIDEPALQCREPRAAQSPEMQDDGCGNLSRTYEGTLGDAWRRVGKMHEDTWSGRSSIYFHFDQKQLGMYLRRREQQSTLTGTHEGFRCTARHGTTLFSFRFMNSRRRGPAAIQMIMDEDGCSWHIALNADCKSCGALREGSGWDLRAHRALVLAVSLDIWKSELRGRRSWGLKILTSSLGKYASNM